MSGKVSLDWQLPRETKPLGYTHTLLTNLECGFPVNVYSLLASSIADYFSLYELLRSEFVKEPQKFRNQSLSLNLSVICRLKSPMLF